MIEKKRLLIVDDEEDIREVARLSLEIIGCWEVYPAGGGREAMSMAGALRPDAILLDVMMPEIDGPTTFRRLRETASTRQIPVILLTASDRACDRQFYVDLGVTGVIPKPFDPVQLPGIVASMLGWSR